MDAATKRPHVAADTSKQPSAVLTGLNAGLKSPLLWGPVLGIAVTLAGIHLPVVVASSLELIGSATSGVAVFAVGLVLAAHRVRLSPGVFGGSLARVTVQSAVLFALLHLLHVVSPFARESLVCCSFPVGTVLVLFAARYKAAQSETASMLLISTLALAYGAGDTLDKHLTGGSKPFCSRSVSSLIVKVGASFPNGGFYVEKRC